MPADSFTTTILARMTGLSVRQLDYWAKQGIVVPSVQEAKRRGSPKRYSLADLVQLCFIAQLKRKGWSTQKIREAIVGLRLVMDDPNPLRTATIFDGKGTILALCKTQAGEHILVDTQRPGQQVMWMYVEALAVEAQGVASRQVLTARRRSEVVQHG